MTDATAAKSEADRGDLTAALAVVVGVIVALVAWFSVFVAAAADAGVPLITVLGALAVDVVVVFFIALTPSVSGGLLGMLLARKRGWNLFFVPLAMSLLFTALTWVFVMRVLPFGEG